MTVEVVVPVVFAVLVGGIAGWGFVPWAADLLLKRAYGRSCSWWWDSYQAYCSFRQAHPRSEPSISAFGEEGALGIWRDDAVRAALAGTLTSERVGALVSAGFKLDANSALREESEQERRCSFEAKQWQRGICAAGGMVAGFVLVAATLPTLPRAAFALCVLAMAVATVCDLRARMLPLECCAVVAAAGSVFQIAMAGVMGWAAGALCAVVVVAGCAVANRLFCRGGSAPVGHGDIRCMAALCLTTGAGALPGLVVCYVAAAVFSIAGMALHKLSSKDGIPMAPFLMAWLVSGVYATALG